MTGELPRSGRTGAVLLWVLCMVGGYFYGHLRGFGAGMVKFFVSLSDTTPPSGAFRFGRMEQDLLWALSAWMLVAVAIWLLHRRFRQLPTLCALTGAGWVFLCYGVLVVLVVSSPWIGYVFQNRVGSLVMTALRALEYPGMLLLGYGLLRFQKRLATGAPESLRERQITGAALSLVLLSLVVGLVSGYLDGSRHATNLLSFGTGPAALGLVETEPVLRESKLPDNRIVFEYLPGVMGWALATAGMVALYRRLRGVPLFFAAAGSGIALLVLAALAVLIIFPWLYPPWRHAVSVWNPLYLGLYFFGGGLVMFTTGRAGLADDVHGPGTLPQREVAGDSHGG